MLITDLQGKTYTQPKGYPRNNSYQINFKGFYFENKGKISKAVCVSDLSYITQAGFSATQPKEKDNKDVITRQHFLLDMLKYVT